jgi:hypothetical protein
MIMEKRRGMATRAKVKGSWTNSFRSPIYVTPPLNVSLSRLCIKHSSSPFNLWRSKGLSIITFTILQHKGI